MRTALLLTPALLVVGGVVAQPKIHPDELRFKPEIDAAIAKGVEALLKGQYSDGTWGRWGNYPGGKTALCTYALLKCGVSASHPAVRRAFLYLDTIQPPYTYTAACLMLAYGSTGLPEHRPRIKKLTSLLIRWQKEGGDFGYPKNHNTTRADLSNTQYAALGLWMAQKHKFKIPGAIWRKLLRGTLDYREKPRDVATKRTGKHTVSAGKMKIAGFGYRPRGKPTGSMTAAGVSILQMCKIGLGENLGRGDRSKIDDAVEMGLGWLGYNFSVTKNPGHGAWLYYFLYGLERVGSLTRVEQMGDRWWYIEGAKYLVAEQERDGMWKYRDQPEGKTAFALLFLRRATSLGAVETGKSGGNSQKHLFTAGVAKDNVQIGGAGQQPLSLWVKGFGQGLIKKHGRHGLRIVQVEYLEGDRVLGQVAGNPTKAWLHDAFLYRAHALPRGSHKIRARIKLVAADVPPGELKPTETVESPEMKVNIRDIFALWMEDAARMASKDLLRDLKKKATASSVPKKAKLAFDGRNDTHWVCAPGDPYPSISVELQRAVKAGRVVFTQASARAASLGDFDRIKVVEIRINNQKAPIRVELDPDQIAVTTFVLPKPRSIRRLSIRIVERVPGRQKGRAGFSKIVLAK
jgi:hypothetical protein